MWRDVGGVVRVETIAGVPPVDGVPVDALLDVLSFTVLDSGEVASCMGLRDDEARRLLGWLERRREIVATPGGGWHRLAG